MYEEKTFVALIPARAGSVSIKDKNLQKVGSETILARSIRHAKESKYVDQVVVSTNGETIKKEAIKRDALIINRPMEISGPVSSTEKAMLHAIEVLPPCDYVVLLQPTSPFRSDGLIDRCIERVIKEKADSLIGCWKFHNFCFYQEEEDGEWVSVYDYVNRPMHEQLDISEFRLFDCGNIYITKTSCLKATKCRIGGKIIIEPISLLETIQIDSLEELETCRHIVGGRIDSSDP